MAYSTAVVPDVDRPLAANPRQLAKLHARVVKDLPQLRGRLTQQALGQAVARSVAHRFRGGAADAPTVARYVASLHGVDLALATACAAGDDAAWNHFVITHRPILYRAARAMTGDETAARDLADTLWAELYGVGSTRASIEAGTPRRSLFEYFHGRSKLSTWLHSILAQRHVDLLRERQRLDSLDGDDAGNPRLQANQGGRSAVATESHPDPDRDRYVAFFEQALHAALGTLEPRDSMRLGCYYTQELTLAETGRILGEHEATVSRKLARTRTRIRVHVELALTRAHGLSPAEIELCYQFAVDQGIAMQELGKRPF